LKVQCGRVCVGLIFAAAILGICHEYILAEWHARDAEREISDLASKIPNSATAEQVTGLARGNYKHLKFAWPSVDLLYFSTPSRFGASDWTLLVDFERGHAVRVRVRTSDSSAIRPDGAPLDRTLK
jgi:hypothetical protein